MTSTPPTPASPTPSSSSPDASSPTPSPASPTKRVLSQARFEAQGLLRHGEQLIVSMVLPLMALVGLALVPWPELAVGDYVGVDRIQVLTPGVLALAVISTAFTGQAILLGFERRWGVLRMLGTTPLGRGGLLAAKGLSVLVVVAVQVLVIGVAAAVLGWRPYPWTLLVAVPALILGALTFAALAACVGGALRAEATLAVANLIWILLAAGGGVLIPAVALPDPLGILISLLPSSALADLLRGALVYGTVHPFPLVVLLVWGALASLLARRLLRWSD